MRIVSKDIIRTFGTTQLRCLQPAEYLVSLGHRVKVGRLYRSIPGKGEINILHRAVLDQYTERFILYAQMLGNPVVYDTDDLIFNNDVANYLSNIGEGRYQFEPEGYLKAIQACDAVTVSTTYLANRVKKFHPQVYLLRNALSRSYIEQAQKVVTQKKECSSSMVTIAYLSGSNTHSKDFRLVESALLALLKDFSDCKVLLVGPLAYSDDFYAFGARFEHRDFIPYKEYVSIFNEIDINLVPLEVNEAVCQGKSELKYIEAGACAVPSVASPTDTFSEVIENGVNGLLVNDDQWYDQIKSLIADPAKRTALGVEARSHVILNYSPEVRRLELEQIMQNIWSLCAKQADGNKIGRQVLRMKLEKFRACRFSRIWLRKSLKYLTGQLQ